MNEFLQAIYSGREKSEGKWSSYPQNLRLQFLKRIYLASNTDREILDWKTEVNHSLKYVTI